MILSANFILDIESVHCFKESGAVHASFEQAFLSHTDQRGQEDSSLTTLKQAR